MVFRHKEENAMRLARQLWGACRAAVWWLALLVMAALAEAQGISTTTVEGTVYLANGQPGSGTLVVHWPAFTTAAGQAVAAGSLTVSVAADGYVSVNLAPNAGSTPAGEYYTAVYYLSDGSSSTEYWVVPAAGTATLAQVRAQVMPAAQAVQAVSKSYVDDEISELTQSLLTASGGNLTGPLYLNGDPAQPLQAADKRYVDAQVGTAVPLTGGTMTGALTLSADPSQAMQAADKEYVDAAANAAGSNAWPAMVLRADEFAGADFGAKLQACVQAVSANFGGTCDARNFSGSLAMSANLTITTANTTVLLPCATIATANQIVIAAGARNVALRGCALRGGSSTSGSQGGTAWAYSGSGAMIQVGDPTYAVDTPGFHLDNVVINTTGASSGAAEALAAYRTQELDLESVYLLGNANQTAMTLDGTGNYTGGTFLDDEIGGYQTAVNAIGHQVANGATTDWVNASTFVRLHIDCPTSNGNPIAGTYGINLQEGDGNTFTGGDVEGCATALHLGANAQNNTIVGLRNENSTMQVVADAGSSYNSWITAGTMFTGKLTDNGTHNSFWDSFHRGYNGLNGDIYRSQTDATVTNHWYLGTGQGNVRGLQDEYITDVPGSPGNYQNAWTWGPEDGAGGQQTWALDDMLNNVPRFGVQQNTAGGGSPQTYLNAAGGGSVCFNCSTNAGSGGVSFSSGGVAPATVASIGNTGNAQFNGTLQAGGTMQSAGTMTVRNNADAEVDYYLWPGLTTSQKGSYTYKDWNGNSQWYMQKDASNNWALNSAVGGLDSFKAYQSTNSGDTYVNASNGTGVVRVNYETGSGSGFKIYGGNSSSLYASFTGTNAIAFPGLKAASGYNCLQIDSSGYITNTGSACGAGSGSGTVGSGSAGQIAYYTGSGTAIGGMNAVPLTAGGTGASSAAAALSNLGALPAAGGTMSGPLTGTNATFSGAVTVGDSATAPSVTTQALPGYRQNQYGAASRNRDGILQITLTPQDMPGCSQAGSGLIDDAVCFNKAITYLETLDNNTVKRLVVPYTANGYQFLSTNFQVTLPYDFGDYHGYAGDTSPAAVVPQFVNGALVSCSVSGGAGYAPSANLQVYIQDPSLQGSGATATVQTNSTGVPTGCTVTNAGMNYPAIGPTAFVVPLGGDGAAGTATLSGGVITGTTTSAGGSGYATGVPVNAPGLTCSSYPTFTATVTSASVASVSYTAGSGCTYESSSSGTVPLVFGASCGGSQCTLLAPETPVNQACSVALIKGLTIEGVGNPTITTTWSTAGSYNTSQPIAFCDPSGLQGSNVTVKNLTVNAYVGFYFPSDANHFVMDNVTFTGGLPVYAYSFGASQEWNGNKGFYPRSQITNSYFNSMAPGVVCGGAWAGRNPTTNSGSLAQLYNMAYFDNQAFTLSNYTNPEYAGRCSRLDVNNVTLAGSTDWSHYADFDQWFEANIWKTQDGPASPVTTYANLSNGVTSCKITQTVSDRTTDYNFGYLSLGSAWQNYPYYQCYPGIVSAGFTFYPRYSASDATNQTTPSATFSGINTAIWRPIFNGRFDALTASDLSTINVYSGYADPYVQSGEAEDAVNVTQQVPASLRVVNFHAQSGGISGVKALLFGATSSSNAVYLQNVSNVSDALGNGVTATTQSPGDNSTRVATDAFVAAAVSGINPITLKTNAVNNASQSLLNLINSSTNAAGLTLTLTNTTSGTVQGEIAGTANAGHGGTGTTNLTGVRYANGGSADTAATSAQVQTAIGAGVYDASGAAAARAGTGSCTSGQFVTADTTSGPTCTTAPSGTVSMAAPYLDVGSTLYLSDGFPVTLPPASGSIAFIDNTGSASYGTNGDLTFGGLQAFRYILLSASTKVQAAFRVINYSSWTNYAGPYIYDSTNSKLYAFIFASPYNGIPDMFVMTCTWDGGSDLPSSCSNGTSVGFGSGQNSPWTEAQIVISGTTASFQISGDGGGMWSTFTTQSVGTITKGGFASEFGNNSGGAALDLASLLAQ